jgi:hypothetical protein
MLCREHDWGFADAKSTRKGKQEDHMHAKSGHRSICPIVCWTEIRLKTGALCEGRDQIVHKMLEDGRQPIL